jgi:hypothetical protein
MNNKNEHQDRARETITLNNIEDFDWHHHRQSYRTHPLSRNRKRQSIPRESKRAPHVSQIGHIRATYFEDPLAGDLSKLVL